MSQNKHIILAFLFAFLIQKSQAQDNLVPNGDFENVENCVIAQKNNDIPRFWFSPHNRIIPLDDPCFYGGYRSSQDNVIGINGSKCGYMETYGFFSNVSHHRAYLATKLTKPLIANQKYYFEMSFRTIDTVEPSWVSTDFTDGHSLAFSKDFPIYNWNIPNIPLSLEPVLSHGLINNFKWHKLKGCFTAKGNEQYLVIGNFKENSEIIRTPTGLKNTSLYNSSSILVDNVVLTPVTVNLNDTAVCYGEAVAFDVSKPFIDSLQYRWHDGGTTPQYKATKTDFMSVKVIYPTENCVAEGSASVKILEQKYQPLAKDTTVCQNEKVTFTAGTGILGETIFWKNGSKNRKIEANTEGVYLAEIKNSCANWTDTFRLRIEHCGFDVYVPTAFSPNNDGVNDDFKPFIKMDFIKIKRYNLRLFNRWGSLVFDSQNVNEAWNGTYRDHLCENGIYIWSMTVQVLLNGKVQIKQLSGDVTIIR